MPSFHDHNEHSHHNLRFLNSFFLKHSNDWAITVMFYSTVHMVEAILDKDYFIHCPSHQERSDKIANTNLPGFPVHSYKALEREAHHSRYKGYKILDIEVHELFNNHFQKLIQWFNNQVKQNETLNIQPCKNIDSEWYKRFNDKDEECKKYH